MALNFPSSPATNDTYTFGNKSWTYDGVAWVLNGGSLTTAVVPESGNLYYTDTRARAAISVTGAGSYDNSTGIITVTGGVTSVAGATGAVSNAQITSGITSSGILTTANVSEVTNLYFTNARVYSNVTSLGYITASSLSGYATNTQLASYATNAQLASYATVSNVALKANVADLTTANVVELTNLYFSNARVATAIVGQTLTNATFSGNVTTGNLISSGSISANGTVITGGLSGFYVDTVAANTTSNVIYYNASTKELTYGAAPSSGGASGYPNSSTSTFASGNTDFMASETYVGQSTSQDAFGVGLVTVFSLMDPIGSVVSVDLGTL